MNVSYRCATLKTERVQYIFISRGNRLLVKRSTTAIVQYERAVNQKMPYEMLAA